MYNNNDNDVSFKSFWKVQGVNQIIGLILTIVVCVFLGFRKIWVSIPVWIIIGVVFWLIRMWFLYRKFRREQE